MIAGRRPKRPWSRASFREKIEVLEKPQQGQVQYHADYEEILLRFSPGSGRSSYRSGNPFP